MPAVMPALDRLKIVQLDRPLFAVAIYPRHEPIVAIAGGRPDRNGDGLISVIDTEEGKLVSQLVGHDLMTRALAFSCDGFLASGGRDGTARLWRLDSKDGKPIVEMRHERPVLGVAFSPDGKWLATAAGHPESVGQMGLWSVPDGKFVREFTGHRGGIYSVMFDPSGDELVSSGIDHSIRVHEVASGRQRLVLEGHQAPCWTAAYHPNGEQIASGSHDHSVKLWSAATGELLHSLEGHEDFIGMVRYHPTTAVLASTSEDGHLRFWDSTNGSALGICSLGSPTWGIDFSVSGKRLAFARLDGKLDVMAIE